MRILANENFPGDAVEALRERGYDMAWVRSDAPGSSDEEILARAQAENRIIVTFDKDFGELAFRSRLPASSGVFYSESPHRRRSTLRGPPWQPWRAGRTGRDILPSSKIGASA
jgi:hypothetical protein